MHLDSCKRVPCSGTQPDRTDRTLKHAPGDDQYGYEDAGERWMPVHTVESIVSLDMEFLAYIISSTPNTVTERYLSLVF